jgi:N4-(beta-N-acetylglucosaminyl)-L-asparaginase
MSISRRDFIAAGAAAAAGLALPQMVADAADSAATPGPGQATDRPFAAARPVAIASANGLRGIARAVEMMRGGADPLDAALAGVVIQELDPEDNSVGIGGLPNEDGVVQLDASCMHGPTRRAGAVASLEGIATPSLVAKAVMDYTDHILLVGPGALRFARQMGFRQEELLTERSRQMWHQWKSRLNPHDNWLDVDTLRATPTIPRGPGSGAGGVGAGGIGGRDAAGLDDLGDQYLGTREKLWYDERGVPHTWGTVNICAVNATGDIGSVTTTSGLSWKIAGRVGDSPIVGAGQYCDNDVGAAGSTGRGEANIKVCGAFLAVEFMRQGMSPEQALIRVMERVIAMTERRLLDDRGRPYFDLSFYALAKDGRYAGATAYEGGRIAVADERGARLENSVFLFRRDERPQGRPMSGTMPRN